MFIIFTQIAQINLLREIFPNAIWFSQFKTHFCLSIQKYVLNTFYIYNVLDTGRQRGRRTIENAIISLRKASQCLKEIARGRGLEVGKMGQGGQKLKTFSYKINNNGDVIYSVMTIVNNTILHILKLLRK